MENEPSYGCDESKFAERDDDSVVEDRCWEEQYRGDSRKWLIRDASRQKVTSETCSTMKATFLYPQKEEEEDCIGVRRKMFQQLAYKEAEAEIVVLKNQQPPVEEYCTEYDGNYNLDGFVAPEEDLSELHLKYPLYKSGAVSYWKYQIDKGTKGMVSLEGHTKAVDIKNPFKRNYNFTKPLSECYDEW